MKSTMFILIVTGLLASPSISAVAMERHIGLDGPSHAANMQSRTVKDPVCGMEVDSAKTRYVYEYQGKKYYFCMKDDFEKFKKDPRKYIHE